MFLLANKILLAWIFHILIALTMNVFSAKPFPDAL